MTSVPAAIPFPPATRPFSINRLYAVTILSIHLLALLAFLPGCFSWIGFWAMVIGIHVFGQGITIFPQQRVVVAYVGNWAQASGGAERGQFLDLSRKVAAQAR